MRFLCVIAKELCYAGLDKVDFFKVQKPVAERNKQSIAEWSFFVSFFWIMSLIFSLGSQTYAACRIIYITALILNLITFLSGAYLIDRFPWLLFPTMYLFEISVLGAGLGISICQPDVRTVTLIAVALIIPICFIDRTITAVKLQLLTIIAFAVLAKNIIIPEVYSWELLNLIIFSSAGLMAGHGINKARYERYVYAESEAKLVEMQKNYNQELQKDVEAKTERIVAMHDHLVIGLATMVESRDNSTGGHIRRTSAGVRILVETIQEDGSLHLTDAFCDKIIKAAPMHNIGKIVVDDSILRKPGRYTKEEYDEMKKHAAEGAKIIHNILIDTYDDEFRQIAENVAHYHHEWIDGTGYPDGLKGDAIPLEARIMAIADVYDALVSRRVYKERYSFEKADSIIMDEMGTHFDIRLKPYYEAAREKLEAYYRKELMIE